ncbi:MAG TPA: DUF2974 domain-containing protein [Pseudomonadota bacterium]|nr:DUF2974 domain-containing protein [Pseudomonadota bacterium]
MSGDTGFATSENATLGAFSGGAVGGGFVGYDDFDATDMGTGFHIGSGSGGEMQLGKDTKALSDQVGSKSVKENAQKEEALPSRAEVMADPAKYGMTPGMKCSPEEYAQQYFHEALAKLSYKDPQIDGNKDPANGYSAADQKFLQEWGYKFSKDVRGDGTKGNTESGLYAARFEPIDAKSKMPPIVAFRGSEFSDGMVDWRSDLLDPSVGSRQYNAEKKAIDDLMKVAPGQKLEVTGHSLGGALAQRAAAEHAKDIGAVTTFQAPGIDGADAAKFNAANSDGHIKVNHHYVTSDVVHRAGEAKLGGNFYEHHVPGAGLADIGASHTANLLHNPHDGSYIGDGSNPLGKRDEVKHHDKDVQGDRHFFEGMRQLLGNGLGGPIEGIITGITKAGGGVVDAVKDVGAGLKNGFMSAMHGLTGGMSTAWDGAKKGGSELVGGFKQLMSGNLLGGLGGIGSGLFSGAKGLVQGAGQAIGGVASGAWDVAKGVGSGLWDAGKGLVGGAGDMLGGLGRGLMGIPKGLAHLGIFGAEKAWEGAKGLGNMIAGSDAGQGIANGAKHAIGGAGHAIGNAGRELGGAALDTVHGIGHGAHTAWDGAKTGGGEILHGASDLLHGKLGGLGGIGKGLVHGAGGLLKGGAEAGGAVLKGIGSGAAAVGKGALNVGKAAVGGIAEAGKGIASTVGKGASAAWDGAKNVGSKLAGGAKKLLSGW